MHLGSNWGRGPRAISKRNSKGRPGELHRRGPGPRTQLAGEGAGRDAEVGRGPPGEVSVLLTPKRALEMARELTQRAVLTIKTNQWGPGWPELASSGVGDFRPPQILPGCAVGSAIPGAVFAALNSFVCVGSH